jgi:hypothetical protein
MLKLAPLVSARHLAAKALLDLRVQVSEGTLAPELVPRLLNRCIELQLAPLHIQPWPLQQLYTRTAQTCWDALGGPGTDIWAWSEGQSTETLTGALNVAIWELADRP